MRVKSAKKQLLAAGPHQQFAELDMPLVCVCSACRRPLTTHSDTDGDGLLIEVIEPCRSCLSRRPAR